MKFKYMLLPLLALITVSCVNGSSSSSSEDSLSSVEPSTSVSEEPSVSEAPPLSEYPDLGLDPVLSTNEVYDNRELEYAIDMTALESIGDQKLMVVPVVFSNTTSNATPEVHEMINKVFFGESDDTGWESVASYYHKSSLGKLTLTGEVMPYFHSTWSTHQFGALTVSETQEYGAGNYWDQTHHMLEAIYATYDSEVLREYDQDGDGHVDAIYMVYIANIHALGGEDGDPFWAYKFYWNRAQDVTKPTFNTYAWSSYKFAEEGTDYTMDKPDGHTFIHEMGHVFGLADYYDYDSKKAPTGVVDMMDNNIIDHNIYSKFALNWVTPYVAQGTGSVTLRPAESSGDFLLIKDGWNGHAYDEYLALEYYTPTGLNEKDSSGNGYTSKLNTNGTKGFTESGVRIWHVDSRLMTYVYDAQSELADYFWNDEIVYDKDRYTEIGPSNTGSRSTSETENLLHLLDGQGKTGKTGNWLKSTAKAGNNALFKTGQGITGDNWAKYFQNGTGLFNDGSLVGYSIEIGEMNESGVTIILTKHFQ